MQWYNYLIVIVVTVIVTIIVIRLVPRPDGGSNPNPAVQAGGAYHTWLYVDKKDGVVRLSDVAGNKLENFIVTYKGDELIFVNRLDDKVTVSFTSSSIFGASQQLFDIESFKRARKKVIGDPGEYTFELITTGGPVGPPKVKVGVEP